jgi:hypothetical protein
MPNKALQSPTFYTGFFPKRTRRSYLMACPEPVNLHKWRTPTVAGRGGRLFTCGRPGRGTFGRERRLIDDNTIGLWVKGLPEAEQLDIVSLLGKKTDGFSEFGYYPFRSSKEPGSKPTFQQWLDDRYKGRFVVHEFPTTDAQGIPLSVRKSTTRRVRELIAEGRTVVIIDSAGAERTSRVCEALGYKHLPER